MTRRTATTLVEVLVAVFVTAVGLLALLALFPLGALSMAQAIKDTRTGHASDNAGRFAEALNLRQDNQVLFNLFAPIAPGVPVPSVFQNPNTAAPVSAFPIANDFGPGYPVYLDPVGFQAFTGTPGGWSLWVGGSSAIARRNIDVLTRLNGFPLQRQAQTLALFSMLDDISFVRAAGNPQTDSYAGLPCVPTPAGSLNLNGFERDGRYSWAYLLTRPTSSVATTTNLTVVVYNQRQLQLGGSVIPKGEDLYTATGPNQIFGNAGSTTLTLSWPATSPAPQIRPGVWILDASQEQQVVTPGLNQGWAHSFFYRVVGMSDPRPNPAVANMYYSDLELQIPLKYAISYVPPSPVVGAVAQLPQIVVMDNVAEVFDKGTGWPSPTTSP